MAWCLTVLKISSFLISRQQYQIQIDIEYQFKSSGADRPWFNILSYGGSKVQGLSQTPKINGLNTVFLCPKRL